MPLFSSVRRSTSRLRYYEDIYGKKNVDEVLDRADQCEDESSNDEGEQTAPSNNRSDDFFKKFSSQGRKGPSSQKISEPSITNLTSSNTYKNTDSDEQGHDYNYKISPKVNSKRSVRAPSKMLTPTKGGLFSDLTTPTGTDYPSIFNNAKQTPTKTSNTMATYLTPQTTSQVHDKSMNPFLNPDGLGDLTDSFTTLKENENAAYEPMPEDTFLAGLSDFANMDIDQGAAPAVPFTSASEWRAPAAEMGVGVGVQASNFDLPSRIPDDNLVDQLSARGLENHLDGTGDQLVGNPVEGTKHRSMNGLSSTTKASSAPKSTANNSTQTRNTLQPNETRHITRGEQRRAADRREAERLAKRPRTRSIAATAGPTTKAVSTRSKDTARHATLHKKAKRKVTREDVARAAEAGAIRVPKGRRMRGTRDLHAGQVWTNFRGEKIRLEVGQGYVVMPVE